MKAAKLNNMEEIWALIGSKLASFLFIWAIVQRYFPYQFRTLIERCSKRLANLLYPYIEVRFFEHSADYLRHSEAYTAIEHYLTSKSSKQARKLNADFVRQSLVLTMDEQEEISDVFQGIKLQWSLRKIVTNSKGISYYPASDKRYYSLTFHSRYRDFVTGSYLKYVIDEGKAIGFRNRQRKIYTNCAGDSDYEYKGGKWSYVVFDHPATFEALAMDPRKKQEIIDDLTTFSKSKEYYARIGKAWKRGYLLYGPPGTGKSTLIAAIANFLKYDIYDLELTAVKTNADLRKLLIGISSKSVIVIEDIDCSLDLTGQRKAKAKSDGDKEEKKPAGPLKKEAEGADNNKSSKVTLSGLLNFIDGIWSASSGERLIIFTTNYVEKLDQALIRRGRMDLPIELSYCDFEGFKVLAKNYLVIESHHLFDTIHCLLKETNITPADVAENLMPKAANEDVEISLGRLIQAIRSCKEEAKMKAEKEKAKKGPNGGESLANAEAIEEAEENEASNVIIVAYEKVDSAES